MTGPLGDDALDAVLEALLFAADRALRPEDLAAALAEELPAPRLRASVERLLRRYPEGQGRGFALVDRGGALRFRTEPGAAPWVRRFVASRPVRLSRAALETLAVIAYRGLATRAEVERVRGVDSGGVLRALLDRRLLRVAGRRDEAGRPIVYAPTSALLELLGLGSLRDLPPLREFTELGPADLEAVADLLEGDPDLRQVTFEEYAARRALVGEAPDERDAPVAPRDA